MLMDCVPNPDPMHNHRNLDPEPMHNHRKPDPSPNADPREAESQELVEVLAMVHSAAQGALNATTPQTPRVQGQG